MTDVSDPSDEGTSTSSEAVRAYSQLLRQQERALHFLDQIAAEVGAPVTEVLLEQVASSSSGEGVAECVREVAETIRETARTAERCRAAIHGALMSTRREPGPTGPSNLPAALARFLAERQESPGFTFDIVQDAVRGWVIRWKDVAEDGTVCGGGQFYERPYAWLEA